ncbi:hypothetical protein C1H46_037240 [Malus baccata]|uniref:Cell division cycle protein 123 homolog n=1 Tax=Malus baccata TaxID=106549 RepID=A0A540KSN6_MALBA|nr:hypothetical protein C1H46_037240 [Malus baccata]
MKEEEVNRCQIQEWYQKFKSLSIKTRIHELPESFVQYLLDDSGPFLLPVSISNDDAFPNRIHNPEEEDDYQVSEGSGDESEQPSMPPSFPELELEVKESIKSLGGSVFPKLNWSAPKDSAWISTTGSLKCSSFSEIALLIRSSDSLVHDLCHAYDSCSDKTSTRPKSFFLAWSSVALFESENYTFDVYATQDDRIKVVDFNPWGAFTLPLMFTWEELDQIRGDGVEFRIVESQLSVRPGLKTAVPFDFLDTKCWEWLGPSYQKC